jgi:hypothetical protein
MIATASEAVDALRHKRTGEILPTKTVARNTKLVYYDDELVGLKFHNTVIARFTTNGCTINTRDRWQDATDRGWWTLTTWARIDEFTKARTFTNGGLRFIHANPGEGAMLFMHGTKLDSNGAVIDHPMEPEILSRVEHAALKLPQKIARHANHVMDAWTDWGEPLPCCREGGDEHYLQHIEANEYVIPPWLDSLAQTIRSGDVWGEKLRDVLTKRLREKLRELTPVAINKIAPEFPYPQLERRRA